MSLGPKTKYFHSSLVIADAVTYNYYDANPFVNLTDGVPLLSTLSDPIISKARKIDTLSVDDVVLSDVLGPLSLQVMPIIGDLADTIEITDYFVPRSNQRILMGFATGFGIVDVAVMKSSYHYYRYFIN